MQEPAERTHIRCEFLRAGKGSVDLFEHTIDKFIFGSRTTNYPSEAAYRTAGFILDDVTDKKFPICRKGLDHLLAMIKFLELNHLEEG